MKSKKKTILYDRFLMLDAFRGLAIIWIVFYHLFPKNENLFGLCFENIVNHGYLGVPIFFVISGYGISASKSVLNRLPKVFLFSRLRRIYPCYWCSLFFAAIVIPITHSVFTLIKSGTFEMAWPYSLSDWFHVLTLTKIFFLMSWDLNTAFDPYNGPIWYLAIIVQIYIFICICLYFKKMFYILSYSGFIISLLTYIPKIKILIPYGFFVPYFAQFYIGIYVFFLLNKNSSTALKKLVSASTLLPIFFIIFFAHIDDQYWNLITAVVSGMVMCLAYKYDSKLKVLTIFKILIFIGSFSYSLYLMHYPLRIYASFIVKNAFPFYESSVASIFEIAIVISLSYLWFLFYEKPTNINEFKKCLCSPIETIKDGINSEKK